MPEPRSTLIFGGTFDPPHVAHTRLAPLAAQTVGCDRILFVPARINPLKQDSPPTADHHRLAMLRLAVRDLHNAEVSTSELERDGPSYTVDTLEHLRDEYGPATTLRLLIGADQALEFDRWKNWQRILELAPPAVMLRPPWDERTLIPALSGRLGEEEANRWRDWLVPVPAIDVSSSDLRRRLREGADVEGTLDPDVLVYIREHGLYGAARAGAM